MDRLEAKKLLEGHFSINSESVNYVFYKNLADILNLRPIQLFE